MSARLVSYAHINVLMSFSLSHIALAPSPIGPDTIRCSIGEQQAAEFGFELLRENVRALKLRYGDQPPLPSGVACADAYLANYRFRPDPRGVSPSGGMAIAIIKATHCYDYQCGELPRYRKTWPAAMMRCIREAASPLLPGYADAPWEFQALALH